MLKPGQSLLFSLLQYCCWRNHEELVNTMCNMYCNSILETISWFGLDLQDVCQTLDIYGVVFAVPTAC